MSAPEYCYECLILHERDELFLIRNPITHLYDLICESCITDFDKKELEEHDVSLMRVNGKMISTMSHLLQFRICSTVNSDPKMYFFRDHKGSLWTGMVTHPSNVLFCYKASLAKNTP